MEFAGPITNFACSSQRPQVPQTMGNDLGFVCEVVRQYLSTLSLERRPLVAACINQILCDAVKPQLPSPPPPTFPLALPLGENLGKLPGRQRELELRVPYNLSPTSSAWSSDSTETPPPENIAFRTIPCRNWIKFKGQCRLGNKCKFIHDPAFISQDSTAEFPTAPTPHCWSYLQGTCQKGRQCKYYHPPAAHLNIYQRYTPCREWDSCISPTCPFRHSSMYSASVNFNIDSPTKPSFKDFAEDPYLQDLQNGMSDRSADSFTFRLNTSSVGPLSSGPYEREFSPLTSLDPIQEELGLTSPPSGSRLATPARRMSMIPTQNMSRMDFGGFDFGTLEPLQEAPVSRPRGKSFDIAFMLPTKRDM